KDELICYECNKLGHYRNESTKLKKNKEQFKKKKAMIATWSDSDYSSFDEENYEEVANIAFMAIKKEEEDEVQFSYSFDELQNAYEKLFYEYENVSLKNITLNKDMLSLSKENESLKNENGNYKNEIEVLNITLKLSTDLKEENEDLKIKVDALQKSFYTFSNSSKKLENLLGLQKCVFDKAGLGYDEMNNVKHYKNFFERKKEFEKEIIKKKIQMYLVIIVVNMDIFLQYVFTRKI
ncbi:hypothetical protein CFOL_v3_05201, partial [Cephalotus follicularis]